MPPSHDDARAADVLDDLEQRPTAAERLLDRIGHRGFSRPRVAVSPRIFRKYRVKDPWNPDPNQLEDPIALGSVGLELGKRLDVAQHLKPPTRTQKKKRVVDPIARFRPKKGQERSSPKPSPAAQQAPPKPPPPPTELSQEFGRRNQRQPLRKPLPVRPDMGAPDADGATTPVSAPAPTRGRSLPKPAGPARGAPKRATGGRFRMAPTATSAPVVKEVRRLDEVTAEEAATPSAVEEAPTVRPAMPPAGDSLDNLFGMAAMAGRMSLGRSRKQQDTDAADDDES